MGRELGQSGGRLRVGDRHARDGRRRVSAPPGPVGDHEIKVYTGYMGQSYLNHEQAPNAYLPRPGFVFRVTPGAAPSGGYVEPYQAQKVPAAEVNVAGAALSMTPAQGPVQTRAVIKRQRLSLESAAVADLGHAGRKPRLRQRLRAEGARAGEG